MEEREMGVIVETHGWFSESELSEVGVESGKCNAPLLTKHGTECVTDGHIN